MVGFLLSGKLLNKKLDENEAYNKAIRVDTTDLFKYGIDTSVGDAFVYGDLKAIDTVTYPEIGGEYMYAKKVREEYTRHTRTVRSSKGKTRTEVYYTWDCVSSDAVTSKEVEFCGLMFSSDKFNIPNGDFIETIQESHGVRYKYYGTPIQLTGTIFANLNRDTQLGDTKVNFYENQTIDEAYEDLSKDYLTPLFWVVWVILICGCVYGFYYLDNEWLND